MEGEGQQRRSAPSRGPPGACRLAPSHRQRSSPEIMTQPKTMLQPRQTKPAAHGFHRAERGVARCWRFFIFIFFISIFYKNIFSIWKFTEVYPGRPAAGRPGPGRPAVGRQGLERKKKKKKIADRSLGPVARQRGGRPPATLYKVFAPSPPFGLLKIRKKRREREGEEG